MTVIPEPGATVVISREQKALLARVGGVPGLSLASALGAAVALTVPLLFVLCGVVVDILAAPDVTGSKAFGQFIANPRQLLSSELSPLSQITLTLGVALVVVLVQVILLFIFYRRVHSASVSLEAAVIDRLWDHSRKLAVVRTLSGQQTALVDGLEYHLPRVRASLSRWWRAWPRHLVQMIACLVLAFLITPLLSLLTIVAAAIVVMVYRTLDRRRRTRLPVVRERATQRRSHVMAMCLKGPLLESVHTPEDIQSSFREELAAYRREAVRSLASSAWKTPLVVALAGLLGGLFIFLVAVQVLRSESSLTIAGCVTFLLSTGGVALSSIRLQRSARELRSVQTAADDLNRFLGLPADSIPVLNAKRPKRVQKSVALEHVTVQDSSGRKLLENISVEFAPSSLIGVIASDRLQASALMELLLGIGRPVSGRMLVDGVSVSDIEPETMKRLGIWVSDNGPLVTASVESNLLGHVSPTASMSLLEALKLTRVQEAIQRLPDGPSTLITPSDDRFLPDTPFRLGIARAILRQASIVVMEEPAARVEARTEQETIEAIRACVNPDTITVLLPQRLSTLRQCDRVILLHDHKIADVGSHTELLQRSDLYRHVNYVRFSPLRHVTV